MSEYRNIFRSRRSSVRRSSQFLPLLLMCVVLVLGPLAVAAYALGYGGGGDKGASYGKGHGKGHDKGGGKGHGHGHGGGSGSGTGSDSGSGEGSGGGTPTVPENPGTGSGNGTPPPGDGSGPGEDTPVDPGTDSGAGDGGDAGTPSGNGTTTPPSTSTPAPESKTDAPSGGVVTDKKSGGKEPSSRGKINGSSGSKKSGSSGNSGSGSGAVASISAAARPAVAPVVAAPAAAVGSKKSSGSGNDSKSSGSNKKSAAENPRKQTTIARAVDGIPLAFRAALLLLIFATSILAVVSFRERRRATAVARVAQLDHLTGLANREGFDRQMAIEWQRSLRHGRPLGMVFVDLDHFKSFNDTHGHVAGDRLLREVAAAITATARGSDFTARLGGDEFVVVCPDTDEEGLQHLVRRLRIEASGMAVSLSVGAAAKLDSDSSPDELVHRADVAMYAAKGGRRRGAKSANPMLGSLRRS